MKNNDLIYIALGALYLVIGMLLGIGMGIRQDFQLAPAHAHINGWLRSALRVWSYQGLTRP